MGPLRCWLWLAGSSRHGLFRVVGACRALVKAECGAFLGCNSDMGA
jgi:hypothetical protein